VVDWKKEKAESRKLKAGRRKYRVYDEMYFIENVERETAFTRILDHRP